MKKIDYFTTISLILFFILALSLRLYKLDAQSLSDDEANKIQAAQMYRNGNFSYNLEHPMLMKSLITFTLIIAEKWNNLFANKNELLKISYEIITRFPNAFFGALTTIILFLLAKELFNKRIALITSALWATGINSIAINRIAKEDTLLVFFMLLGLYFYIKAKWLGPVESYQRLKLYIFSGISFGLMLASKYFPHYFGLNFLYHYTRPHEPNHNYRVGKNTITKLFIALFISFAIANPSIFLPNTIHYIFTYVSGIDVIHHGYEMMNHLYYNNFWKVENPTPPYFYLLFILVKIPPILIILFFIGVIIIFQNKYHDGYYLIKFMILFWIIPFSFITSKWLRYTLQFMPFFYLTCAISIDKIYENISRSTYSTKIKNIAIILIITLFISLTYNCIINAPYYLQYVNIFGGGKAKKAYYFPHDEVYDTGIREAVSYISQNAPLNSIVACDAPNVVNFYLQLFKRTDINIAELSRPSTLQILQKKDLAIYVLNQKGRLYFSNQDKLDYVNHNYILVKKIKINGITVTKIFLNKT